MSTTYNLQILKNFVGMGIYTTKQNNCVVYHKQSIIKIIKINYLTRNNI